MRVSHASPSAARLADITMTTSESLRQITASYGDALDVGDDPISDLRRLRELCDTAPDNEHLLALAVVMFDHLIDDYWNEIEVECEALTQQSSGLRRCWSCTFPGVPEDAYDRLSALLQRGEDIGRAQ